MCDKAARNARPRDPSSQDHTMRLAIALLALCSLAACSPHPQKRADATPTEQPAAGLPRTLTELLASGKARKARKQRSEETRVAEALLGDVIVCLLKKI